MIQLDAGLVEAIGAVAAGALGSAGIGRLRRATAASRETGAIGQLTDKVTELLDEQQELHRRLTVSDTNAAAARMIAAHAEEDAKQLAARVCELTATVAEQRTTIADLRRTVADQQTEIAELRSGVCGRAETCSG